MTDYKSIQQANMLDPAIVEVGDKKGVVIAGKFVAFEGDKKPDENKKDQKPEGNVDPVKSYFDESDKAKATQTADADFELVAGHNEEIKSFLKGTMSSDEFVKLTNHLATIPNLAEKQRVLSAKVLMLDNPDLTGNQAWELVGKLQGVYSKENSGANIKIKSIMDAINAKKSARPDIDASFLNGKNIPATIPEAIESAKAKFLNKKDKDGNYVYNCAEHFYM